MPIAYITAPSDAARELAATLVEERLAACVTRVPVESVYRWESDLRAETEVALLAKTTADRYDRLEARVLDLHPHDVPCIDRWSPRSLQTEAVSVAAAWTGVRSGGVTATAGPCRDRTTPLGIARVPAGYDDAASHR